MFHDIICRVLAAAITVKDHVCRQIPAILSGLEGSYNQHLFHVLGLARCQDRIPYGPPDASARVVRKKYVSIWHDSYPRKAVWADFYSSTPPPIEECFATRRFPWYTHWCRFIAWMDSGTGLEMIRRLEYRKIPSFKIPSSGKRTFYKDAVFCKKHYLITGIMNFSPSCSSKCTGVSFTRSTFSRDIKQIDKPGGLERWRDAYFFCGQDVAGVWDTWLGRVCNAGSSRWCCARNLHQPDG